MSLFDLLNCLTRKCTWYIFVTYSTSIPGTGFKGRGWRRRPVSKCPTNFRSGCRGGVSFRCSRVYFWPNQFWFLTIMDSLNWSRWEHCKSDFVLQILFKIRYSHSAYCLFLPQSLQLDSVCIVQIQSSVNSDFCFSASETICHWNGELTPNKQQKFIHRELFGCLRTSIAFQTSKIGNPELFNKGALFRHCLISSYTR